MEFQHTSVMLKEAVGGLNIRPDGVYIDATLGGGGHSAAIAEMLATGQLISIDQDDRAIAHAAEKLAGFGSRVRILHGNFSDAPRLLLNEGISFADGVLMDLGVSSHQFDDPERGFTYNHNARLDMRMNQNSEFSAYELVNNYSENEISRILWDFGEEKWARRIAQFICINRLDKPIETTFDLVSAVKAAIPKNARKDGKHPAKRSFMAIRIAVNNEIEILERSCADFIDFLRPGGRICCITFHSLEDRIIKQLFARLENPCVCPREFPKCACGNAPVLKRINRKPITPCISEIQINPRSRSAKLRIAEKL